MRTRSRLRYWIASARWPVEIKVFEQGGVFFRDLVQIRTKYGLEKWAFELKRHGAAKDLKTTYSILPEHQLAPEQQREFQALRLHDLDTRDAEVLAEAVRRLLRELLQRERDGLRGPRIDRRTVSLHPVRVPRLAAVPAVDKDLPARQVEKALPYLDLLDAECKAIAQSETAVDPFA